MFSKNLLLSVIIIIPALFGAGCNSNTANNSETPTDSMTPPVFDTTDHSADGLSADTYTGAMYTMIKNMKAVHMTGDFDIDFAKIMMEHHQGAIALSGIELNTGKDDVLREMARRTIDVRSKEVAELQKIVNSYQASGKKHGEDELEQSMEAMEKKLESHRTTAYPDKDFAIMMTLHHEGAINMANKELNNGMSETLKQMAQRMVDESSREIRELEKFTK